MGDTPSERTVTINIDGHPHLGELVIPGNAQGMVLFAHGSGSSRLSPRNTYVANILHQGCVATLLFDLLTEAEDMYYETRFDIDLLTNRLLSATEWVSNQSYLQEFPIGYFGASTGAAAALMAAAILGENIRAVVSRGGRPDMAMDTLSRVKAPTLLIVGGYDETVLELNEQAYAKLECTRELKVVSGATHLFEEPGTLEQVAQLARDWFVIYLPS